MIKNFALILGLLLVTSVAQAQIYNSDGDTRDADAYISNGDLTVVDDLVVADTVTSGVITASGLNLSTGAEAVAGAGTTVADAAELSATIQVHRITGANGTVGWKFAAATPINSVHILLNTTAGVAKVYADSGGTVNGGSADAAFTALTGIKPIICIKTAALTFLCA